jgi:hypothetical protein
MTNADNQKARMLALSELEFCRYMLHSVETSLDTLLSLRFDLLQEDAANAKAIALTDSYIRHEHRRQDEWQGKVKAYKQIVDTLF